MKTSCSNRRNDALTLMEVAVTVVVITLLAVVLLPALNRAKVRAQRISCVSNLKQFGLAFRIWSGDNTNLYPMSLSTNFGGTKEYLITGETFRHFQVMSNELSTPVILVCPSDRRQPAKDFAFGFGNVNLSYFVGVDATESNPQTLLSGDYNITGGTKLPSGLLELTTHQPGEWSSGLHYLVGNIALADGSVQQVSTAGLQQALQNTGLATNRLAMP
jgi:hypothetical protein